MLSLVFMNKDIVNIVKIGIGSIWSKTEYCSYGVDMWAGFPNWCSLFVIIKPIYDKLKTDPIKRDL